MKRLIAAFIIAATLSQVTYAESFTATGYCSCRKCCGKWADGKTASGTIATAGRTVAVDKKVIPLGTKVLVNGTEYVAEDTGVKGKWIDIYFDSHSEALKFGKQTVEVEIVKEDDYVRERIATVSGGSEVTEGSASDGSPVLFVDGNSLCGPASDSGLTEVLVIDGKGEMED